VPILTDSSNIITPVLVLSSNFQEPWRNPHIATSYHPLKTHFQLAYLNDKDTRVCFYINKRIDASTWNVSFVTKDVIVLEIIHPVLHHKLSIINVYNELGTNTLDDLRQTMATLTTDHEIIVLGDFNLHHPLWSTVHRYANHGIAATQPLLAIIEDFQLRLLTVPGTTTHRWKDGETTIDLTFGSEGVASRTVYCRVDTSRDCDSDHLPIATAITWDWQPATPVRKRVWTKTNPARLRQTVKDQLLPSLKFSMPQSSETKNALTSMSTRSSTRSISASMPRPRGPILHHDLYRALVRNARTSVARSNSCGEGGSARGSRTTTRRIDRSGTKRDGTFKSLSATPTDNAWRKHPARIWPVETGQVGQEQTYRVAHVHTHAHKTGRRFCPPGQRESGNSAAVVLSTPATSFCSVMPSR
jgi:hypothetical protein